MLWFHVKPELEAYCMFIAKKCMVTVFYWALECEKDYFPLINSISLCKRSILLQVKHVFAGIKRILIQMLQKLIAGYLSFIN